MSAYTTLAMETLPLLRWGDVAGSLENRTDDVIDQITGLFGSIPVSVEGVMLSLGNGLWTAGAKLLGMSNGSEQTIADAMGPVSNRVVKTIYDTLTGTMMIPALIVAATICTTIFMVFKGQGARVLMQRFTALIVGFAFVLGIGAQCSQHPDIPATGTPWWTYQFADQLVGKTGNQLTGALDASMKSTGAFLASTSTTNKLSCRRYLARLGAEASMGQDDVILRSMNTMWEETGLRMWARAQYGAGENGTEVFCRVLEYRAGANPLDQADRTNAAAMATPPGQGDNVEQRLRSLNGSNSPVKASGYAMAFNPDLLIIDEEGPTGTASDIKPAASAKMLDRMVTMWDVCTWRDGEGDNGYVSRGGWQWVDAVTGPNRGLGNNNKLSNYCRVAISGEGTLDGGNTTDWRVWVVEDSTKGAELQHQLKDTELDAVRSMLSGAGFSTSEQQKLMATIQAGKPLSAIMSIVTNFSLLTNPWKMIDGAKGVRQAYEEYHRLLGESAQTVKDGSGDEQVQANRTRIGNLNNPNDGALRAVVKKFDLSNSNTAWQWTARTHTDASQLENTIKAIATVNQQHGSAQWSDVGGGFIFALSGLVNMLIWGVGFGLLRLLAVALACLCATGLWFALIVWAVSPDRGRKTLSKTVTSMLGMIATPTVLGLYLAVACILMNTIMMALGIVDRNGNTAATVMVMGVCSLVLPLANVFGLRWLCIRVLHVGDPLSFGALGVIGSTVGQGVRKAGRMAMAAGGALAAGATGGAVAMAAMNGARAGSVLDALQHGYRQGQHGQHGQHGAGKGTGSGRHAAQSNQQSEADRAVGSPNGPDGNASGVVDNAFERQLEREQGDHLDSIKNNLMVEHPDWDEERIDREARDRLAADSGNMAQLAANKTARNIVTRKMEHEELVKVRAEHPQASEEEVAALVKQGLAGRQTERDRQISEVKQRVLAGHLQREQVRVQAEHERELMRTATGRLQLARELHTDGDGGVHRTRAAMAFARGEAHRFNEQHPVLSRAAGVAGVGALMFTPLATPVALAVAGRGVAKGAQHAGQAIQNTEMRARDAAGRAKGFMSLLTSPTGPTLVTAPHMLPVEQQARMRMDAPATPMGQQAGLGDARPVPVAQTAPRPPIKPVASPPAPPQPVSVPVGTPTGHGA